MAKEIDWQSKLVKKLKQEGAYARKASSSYAVGVLDLDTILPIHGAMKIEVKLLTELNADRNWSRKIDYTAKQKEESENVIKAGGMALGLVLCHYNPSTVHLFAHRMPTPRESFTLTRDATMAPAASILWRDVTSNGQLSDYLYRRWLTT